MTPYDKTFDPPAPVIQATVSNVKISRLRRTFPALLDTGGDITAIPEGCLGDLKLYPLMPIYISGVHGSGASQFIYPVRFSFANIVIPRLEVILTPLAFIVIGRDLLNRYDIHLYGTQLLFQIDK